MSERAPISVLSDGTIRRLVEEGRIKIEPWDPALVQPASVDLRLGNSFRVFHNHRASAIDLRDPPSHLTEEVKVEGDEPFVIHPGEFALGRTQEWVELPDDIVARIEGKALAMDTAVPTPTGWTRMGDIAVGEQVFDHAGEPPPRRSAARRDHRADRAQPHVRAGVQPPGLPVAPGGVRGARPPYPPLRSRRVDRRWDEHQG